MASRYIKITDECLLDTKTFSLIDDTCQLREIESIDVPYYDWKFDVENDKAYAFFGQNWGRFIQFNRTWQLKLNNFTLVCTHDSNYYSIKGVSLGKEFDIRFDTTKFSNDIGDLMEEDFHCNANGAYTYEKLHMAGAYHHVDSCCTAPLGRNLYRRPTDTGLFCGTDEEIFSYGMPPVKLDITYRTAPLGSFYVWLFGTWCILMNDDFSFNTLATVYSSEFDSLNLAHVLHTVDTNVIKRVVLHRN